MTYGIGSAPWRACMLVLRHTVGACLLFSLVATSALPAVAQDAAPADTDAVQDVVVGDGTAASCDGNALEAAVKAGGTVTFACGVEPVTILANTMVIDGVNTVVNGGGLVTISGEERRQIFIVNANAGLTLRDITLSGGLWGGGGGAIDNSGALLIQRSTLKDNTAETGGNGGAILNRGGTLTIEQSTLQSNTASGDGSGNGGAIAVEAGTVTIRQSTFNGNLATGSGGAFYLEGGDFSLENSTMSANVANAVGGGIQSDIPAGGGSVALVHNTFYLNSDDGAAGNIGAGDNGAPINLRNSILYVTGSPKNCYVGQGTQVVSGDYNLANDDSCGLSGQNDVQNVPDPKLGDLVNNGGPTYTHLPLVRSAAVDTIPAASCPLPVDQRGFPRPQGTMCDKGAVEEVPTQMPPLPINQPGVQPFYLGKLFVRNINLPIFTLNPNIVAQRLEVTQGIQAAAGTGVTLVARKRTYVRFHVRKDLGSGDPVVGARLWRIVGGQRVGDPILPSGAIGFARFIPFRLGGSSFISDPYITVRSSPNRNTLNDSFYFRLPDAWTTAGNLTIEAEVNPTFLANSFVESDHSDNILRTTVTFNTTPTMVLRLYAVSYKKDGVVYTPTDQQLREAEDWLRRAYPIARLVVKRDALDMTGLGFEPDCTRVNGRLVWASIFLRWGGIDPQPTRYYGMVSDGGSSARFMRGCADNIPSFVASGPTGDPDTVASIAAWDKNNDGSSYGDWYMGHELGHTWGRFHVNCAGTEVGPDAAFPLQNGTIGRLNNADAFWGFDVSLKGPVVYPPTWTEIMSYCPNQWISNYTYEAIRNRLVSENSAAEVQGAALTAPADYLILEGSISPDQSTATIRQAYRLTAPVLLPAPTPGGWDIRLLDSGSNVLATYPFTPRIDTDDPSEQNDALIMEQVPWVDSTRRIEVRHGATVLATRLVSENQPSVTVTAPAGGDTVGAGGLTVSWSASDPDGDTLSATVLYSRDGGANYKPLRLHIPGTSINIPASELGYTTQGKIRVIVSDGVLTGQDDSEGVFTAPNQPPAVQILTPAANTTVAYGPALNLSGAASDLEDANLPDSAFRWSSSLDGPLGFGRDLDGVLESVGQHTITLEVVDANGGAGKATRVVTVNPDTSVTAASLNAVPTSTAATLPLGGESSESISLRNPSGAVLAWQASSNAPWLTLDTPQGQTPADPTLRIHTTGLGVGMHVGIITINTTGIQVEAGAADAQAPEGELATQQVRVYLTVTGNTTLLPIVNK